MSTTEQVMTPQSRMDEYKFFNDLCNQVGEWSQHNFGNQLPHRPLIGIIEELLELSTAFEELRRGAVLDAVGDVVIYMADYFYRSCVVPSDKGNWDLGKTWVDRGLCEEGVPSLSATRRLCQLLAHHHLKGEQGIRGGTSAHLDRVRDACRLTLEYLEYACGLVNADIFDVVMETWSRVSKRDWKKNPNEAHKDAPAEGPEVGVMVANLKGVKQLELRSDVEVDGADYVASRLEGGLTDAGVVE